MPALSAAEVEPRAFGPASLERLAAEHRHDLDQPQPPPRHLLACVLHLLRQSLPPLSLRLVDAEEAEQAGTNPAPGSHEDHPALGVRFTHHCPPRKTICVQRRRNSLHSVWVTGRKPPSAAGVNRGVGNLTLGLRRISPVRMRRLAQDLAMLAA